MNDLNYGKINNMREIVWENSNPNIGYNYFINFNFINFCFIDFTYSPNIDDQCTPPFSLKRSW